MNGHFVIAGVMMFLMFFNFYVALRYFVMPPDNNAPSQNQQLLYIVSFLLGAVPGTVGMAILNIVRGLGGNI